MTQKIVTVIGGSGFVGRYVVRELAQAGYRVQVVCRDTQAAAFLKPYGDLGQIVAVHGDLARPETVLEHLPGSYAVVNLVGVLAESGKQTFNRLHSQGAEKIAQAARAARIPHLVHVSALGIDRSSRAKYARSKVLGEKAVRASFPNSVILRPSVIFGQEDNFFNQFARMAMAFPFLPLIGGGKTKFQPVYVADVARAVRASIERDGASGKVYELGGPEVFTFREVLTYILKTTGHKAHMLRIPFPLASLMAFFTEWLPNKPLTRDQVKMLKSDSVVSEDAMTFADLGIAPKAVELIVPEYLRRFRKKRTLAAA